MNGPPLSPYEVLRRLSQHGRPVLRERFRRNNCIMATRTLQDVLMHFGIPNRAVACKVYVFNPAQAQAMEAGVRLPRPGAPEYEQAGYYSLGVDEHSSGPGFSGHMVNLLTEHTLGDLVGSDHTEMLLIDGSVDQFARPERDIHIPELISIGAVPAGWVRGDPEQGGFSINGSAVVYAATPHNLAYISSPDWRQQRDYYAPIRQRLIATIEAGR